MSRRMESSLESAIQCMVGLSIFNTSHLKLMILLGIMRTSTRRRVSGRNQLSQFIPSKVPRHPHLGLHLLAMNLDLNQLKIRQQRWLVEWHLSRCLTTIHILNNNIHRQLPNLSLVKATVQLRRHLLHISSPHFSSNHTIRALLLHSPTIPTAPLQLLSIREALHHLKIMCRQYHPISACPASSRLLDPLLNITQELTRLLKAKEVPSRSRGLMDLLHKGTIQVRHIPNLWNHQMDRLASPKSSKFQHPAVQWDSVIFSNLRQLRQLPTTNCMIQAPQQVQCPSMHSRL